MSPHRIHCSSLSVAISLCVSVCLSISQVQEGGLVATFGEGFFHRAVCCVVLSHDGQFICGIGSDDHHAMGIWQVRQADR